MMRPLVTLGTVLAAVVAAVVFLWPAPRTGSEPIMWGRDTCAHCRMHLSRPGFAGETRDRDGALRKYDDLGCMLDAMAEAGTETPEAWVEDHASGAFVPLPTAALVRVAGDVTPMGSGLVAFAHADDADAFAAAEHGSVVALDAVLHERTTDTPRQARAGGAAGREER